MKKLNLFYLCLMMILVSCSPAATPVPATPTPVLIPTVTPVVGSQVVAPGKLVPPTIATPCTPGKCPFAGQKVTMLTMEAWTADPKDNAIIGPLYEIKQEFEAATGATLEIRGVSFNENFARMVADMAESKGEIDGSIAGSWWLGDLVTRDAIIPYDKYYDDPRFPQWDIEDVLPAPRALLTYDGKKYMVANDHDGQVMYYRRDLLVAPEHQAAFKTKYGYDLAVPQTWAQFRDVAEYFNGKDLNGDGKADSGLTMSLKAGEQGMFHYSSFAAPFVLGPDNPNVFWFDPDTMKSLVDSPGHVKALTTLVDLLQFGPKDMTTWSLGAGWDYFLKGQAALAFTWGDLGAMGQGEGSQVRGKVGVARMPGTTEYYNTLKKEWVKTDKPNFVGNTTGGSWAGVISKYSDAPEATYYLLALMASKQKGLIYAARGWDGVDPGRISQLLPPDGNAVIDNYLAVGWDEADIKDYSHAYFTNFNTPLQLIYLRIPGTFGYWSALDTNIFSAVNKELTPEEALKTTASDFDKLTDTLGREKQKAVYRASLGY